MAFKKAVTKKSAVAAAEVETVKAAVKNVKPADVLSALATAQVEVQKTLASIGSQVNEQITLLDNVKAAVTIEENRLKELHEIDAAAMSLDEFEASVEQKKAEWADAETERQTRWQDEASERQKRWQREAAEYDYATKTERAKEADAYTAELAKRNRDEQIRQETLVKGWTERETALKAQEKEVSDLRATVANIPAEIKKAVDKEVAVATNSVKREYVQQLQIAELTAANDRKISEATIGNLNSTISQLQAQLAAAQAEIKAANLRAETIATKAVEAQSGRQALEAIERQSVVMSQQSGKAR